MYGKKLHLYIINEKLMLHSIKLVEQAIYHNFDN